MFYCGFFIHAHSITPCGLFVKYFFEIFSKNLDFLSTRCYNILSKIEGVIFSVRTKNDKDKIEIGLRIKELRTSLGLSQEDLAKLVGYKSANSRSTINKIEMGINDIAQSKLTVYAAALQTTVTYLLFGTNSEDAPSSATKGQMQLWDEQYNEKNQLQTEVQIIEAVQKHFGKDAVTLLHLFNTLNKSGKKKAVENLEDLTAVPKYQEEGSADEEV